MKKINNIQNKKRALGIHLLLIITLIFVGCKEDHSTEHHDDELHESETTIELSEAQFKMAEIKLGGIEKKAISKVLKANGVIDAPPQNIVSISAPMGGFVVKTSLLQGMKIKKGQALVTLEHPDYVQLQQEYIELKSKLGYLEQEFKRQEELNKEKVSSDKVFQQTQSDYTSAKAHVRGLKEKLEMIGINVGSLNENNLSRRITIYSPINGYVSEVNINTGKFANPTDVMFEIINTQHLHAELTIYEKDLSVIKIGQKIRFSLPDGKERRATIYLIGRKLDADRSIRVHCHLENEDENLLPGMYINAYIELNNNQLNTVPEEAIVLSDGIHYVFLYKEKHEEMYQFEMTEIKKGVTENGYSEISFEKMMPVDSIQLVTKGAFSLLAKMKNTEEEGGHHH